MTGPRLVERAQLADLATRHGLRLDSPTELAAVYGRWCGDPLEVATTWHEAGWWVGITARHPQGWPVWWWKSDHAPLLATVERLVLAAQADFDAERERAA